MKWGNLIKLIVPWCTSVQFAMTNINNNKEWGNMFLFNIILQLLYAWDLIWGRVDNHCLVSNREGLGTSL